MFSRKKKSNKSSPPARAGSLAGGYASTSTAQAAPEAEAVASSSSRVREPQLPTGGLMQLDEHEWQELRSEIRHHQKKLEDFYDQTTELLTRQDNDREFYRQRYRIEKLLAPILFGTPIEDVENNEEEEPTTTTSSLAE